MTQQKHIPSRARLASTNEEVRDLLSTIHAATFERLCGRDWYSPHLKYRIRPDQETHEHLIPVEIRSSDCKDRRSNSPVPPHPRSEWFPFDSRVQMPSYRSIQRECDKQLSENPEFRPDPVVAYDSESEVTWRVYIHRDDVDYGVQQAKKLYSDRNRDKYSTESCTRDELTVCENEIALPSESLYLVNPTGVTVLLRRESLAGGPDGSLLMFVGDNIVGILEDGDVRDNTFLSDVEWNSSCHGDIDSGVTLFPDPNDPLNPGEHFEDFMNSALYAFNDELDDPFITDGEQLAGNDTYWITGSEEDLVKQTCYLFWALVPREIFVDPKNKDENGEPLLRTIDFDIYTGDKDGDGSAEVNYDDWYQWAGSGPSWADTLPGGTAELILRVFEATILEDNYPTGYSYEYNDQDVNRMSGYSRYRNTYTVTVDAPETDKDIVVAKRWVQENLECLKDIVPMLTQIRTSLQLQTK
jgi:hypothetical protein